ncbi:hypothetical protein [Nocardia sp. CNY236]|uniref:PPE domain-containing protein n=1 Tax=Nocardia sp. CNY236 TaxID=1169152 RepID=UPI0003FC8384|nr:hypothetical protein [Nocardia sp. CNY236]
MLRQSHAGTPTTDQRTDPPYAPTVEVFDSLTHAEIHARVQQLDPAVLAGGAQVWNETAAAVSEAVAQTHSEIRAAIADGWRGAAAASAEAAMSAFERDGHDLAEVFAVVAYRLGRACDAAETVRAAVSEPPEVAVDLGAALLNPDRASSNIDQQKASEHARQDVVRVMDDVYVGAFIGTGIGVPAFRATGASAPETVSDMQPIPPDTTDTRPIRARDPNLEAEPNLEASADTAVSTASDEASAQATIDSGRTTAATASGQAMDTASGQAMDTASGQVMDTTSGRAMEATNPPAPGGSTPSTTTAGVAPARAAGDGAAHGRTAPSGAHQAMHDVGTPFPTSATASGVRAVAANTSAPATTVDASEPAAPGAGSRTAPERSHKHSDRNDGGDAVTSLGAGTVGGLMGGALATADAPRPSAHRVSNSTAARAPAAQDDADDIDLDDLSDFLEPAEHDEGSSAPTTPPVLGEWTEDE